MTGLERDIEPMEINFIQGSSKISLFRKRAPGIGAVLLVVLAALLLVWMWLGAVRATSHSNAEIRRVNLRIAELQAPSRLAQQQPAVQQLKLLADQLKQGSPDYVELFGRLSELLPEHVNAKSFSMEGASSFKLTALFADTDEVATLVRSLRASGHFTVAELGNVEKTGALASGQGIRLDDHILPLQTTLVINITAAAAKTSPIVTEGGAAP
jgi:Tfp pilus assembly protein PilN